MRRIQIYDTTLRDGSQAEGISFSIQDKLLLTKRLASLGFDYVEGGYPASNDKDSEYFQRIPEVLPELHAAGPCRTTVCAFGMTRRKGGGRRGR
jgi:2-isopropylmalate synthase